MGARSRPGGFDLFTVFGGPLPTKNTNKLVFKALQTYSDGTVVRWIQTPVKGAPEPDNPAPTLVLTKPPRAADHLPRDLPDHRCNSCVCSIHP